MTLTNSITDFQDAYVRKTTDTLNDLPNALGHFRGSSPEVNLVEYASDRVQRLARYKIFIITRFPW